MSQNCTVRVSMAPPSAPVSTRTIRPDRLTIDTTCARTHSSLTAVVEHLEALPAATLRVYLASLRLLSAWRRDADAVDVEPLAEAAGVSARRVYSAVADLGAIGALTWTGTGPRSGLIGLPAAHSPAPAASGRWDTWERISAAAVTLIDAVLTRIDLEDSSGSGWVCKRGPSGVREASAPVGALRLTVALLSATWASQSPVVDAAAVPFHGDPKKRRAAYAWLTAHADVSYRARLGRAPGAVALPGYDVEHSLGTEDSGGAYVVTEPDSGGAYVVNAGGAYVVTNTYLPGVDPRPPLPPNSDDAPLTDPPAAPKGAGPGEVPHPKRKLRPHAAGDDRQLALVTAAVAALGLTMPATRQGWRSMTRPAVDAAGLLIEAGWTVEDVGLWVGADLTRAPVEPSQIRDPARFVGHMLGKVATDAVAGRTRPSVAAAAASAKRTAAQEAAAAAAAARAAEAQAQEVADRTMVRVALPHLEAMTPPALAALLPKNPRRDFENADLDALPDQELVTLAYAWHNSALDAEMVEAGWQAVAEFFGDTPEDAWLAEQVRSHRSTAVPVARMFMRRRWCSAHHNHPEAI